MDSCGGGVDTMRSRRGDEGGRNTFPGSEVAFRHPKGDYHISWKVSILSMDGWLVELCSARIVCLSGTNCSERHDSDTDAQNSGERP